jgi:hypothetical protein
MDNAFDKNNPKLSGFVGFIPKPLKLEDKPVLSIFPLNVLIGRYTVINNKQVFGSVLYEPDLSSLKIDQDRNFIMLYRSRYDSRYYLKIYLNKGLTQRTCEKYRETELIATADGAVNWEKQDESWDLFFRQVALIGLDNGETCHFDFSDDK